MLALFPASLYQIFSRSVEENLLGIRVLTALLKQDLLKAVLVGPCLAKKTKASPGVAKFEAISSFNSARYILIWSKQPNNKLENYIFFTESV